MYKIWNKQTCYEIYFRPLPDTSKVEVITYLNGDPFCNPMSRQHLDIKDPEDNVEVWSIEDARENWNAWVTHGGYEVAEVEDYLKGNKPHARGQNMNYRKKSERKKSKKSEMTGKYMMDLHKKRMYNE
tara:strand:+ start:205 stop:588 length:384 start_codon:yes stop_codon:yes gene_type:complete